jgi:undecaprenyl phosphate N,N'-diacetylbacillosamine 1-phosphate transferase
VTYFCSYGIFKRIFDILIAGAALILFAPLLLMVAAIIKLTSRGPALFIQERSGYRGRSFRVVKFRTMTTDTKVRIGEETQPDDPRITNVGQWLRRMGIDELPQLLNVLGGQMSIVGPRPLLKWENECCDRREAARLNVRPGLTGLSQIRGRNNIPWERRIAWDLVYVKRASFWLDLYICLRTIPVVLFGQNAYLFSKATAREKPTDLHYRSSDVVELCCDGAGFPDDDHVASVCLAEG